MKKSWRGVGGESAAPPPNALLARNALHNNWVVGCHVLIVLTVVDVAAGGCGGGAGACWGLP